MRVACVWFGRSVPTAKFADYFLRFTPQISLRPDAIFLEIGKCSNLYSEKSFFARAQVVLRRLGENARVSIGDGICDSLTFAKYNVSSTSMLPLQALTDFADPFARDEVLQKQVVALVESFSDLGVKTIGDFKKIPVSQLISRYGVIGRHCYHRVNAMDTIAWPLWVPEEKIFESKQFPYFEFYGELDPILFELKHQLDQIFRRLHGRQQRLTNLRVTIKCEKSSAEPKPEKKFDFGFYSPQGETKGTLRILKEKLSRSFEKDPIKSPIEGIKTEVIHSIAHHGSQKNIFNNDEEKQEQIFSLNNQLVEILGSENVFQAELTQDRRPERGWKKKLGIPHTGVTTDISLKGVIPRRPNYLLKFPLRIEVTAGFIYIKEKRYKILKWNPDVERITGGWYEKPESDVQNTFDRNYSRVVIEGNQHITVFMTPEKKYYLHGYFG